MMLNEIMTEGDFRNQLLDRTMPFLSAEGANILKEKTVVIAGCGGVGAISVISLARAGVGNFRLADPGSFDPPDMNRQIGACSKTMGRNKAEVYAEQIKDINPFANIEVYSDGVTVHNINSLIDGADFLIDCLDLSVTSKLRSDLYKACRENRIIVSSAPMVGFGGVIFISDPDGMSMDFLLDNIINKLPEDKFVFDSYFSRYFMPEHLKIIEEWIQTKKTKVPSISISPMLISGFLCTEILNAFIGDVMPGGRLPIVLPRVLFIDPFRMSFELVNVADL
jgi:tRNA threonylcarbamoyladenosine dehydratase